MRQLSEEARAGSAEAATDSSLPDQGTWSSLSIGPVTNLREIHRTKYCFRRPVAANKQGVRQLPDPLRVDLVSEAFGKRVGEYPVLDGGKPGLGERGGGRTRLRDYWVRRDHYDVELGPLADEARPIWQLD